MGHGFSRLSLATTNHPGNEPLNIVILSADFVVLGVSLVETPLLHYNLTTSRLCDPGKSRLRRLVGGPLSDYNISYSSEGL